MLLLLVFFGAGLEGSGCLGRATAEGAEGSSVVEPWAVLWLAGVCAVTEVARSAAPANERNDFFMVTNQLYDEGGLIRMRQSAQKLV